MIVINSSILIATVSYKQQQQKHCRMELDLKILYLFVQSIYRSVKLDWVVSDTAVIFEWENREMTAYETSFKTLKKKN